MIDFLLPGLSWLFPSLTTKDQITLNPKPNTLSTDPAPSIEHPAELSIFNYQLSIKIFTFAAQSKLKPKMDDGPAKRNDNHNLLSAGMSSLP